MVFMKKSLCFLIVIVLLSSMSYSIDIDKNGTSKFATTTSKPDTHGVIKSTKTNIEGRVWSVVDFSNPEKIVPDTKTIVNTPEKRKFSVVDFNDTIEPETNVTVIPLLRDQMEKDSKRSVKTFTSEEPKIKKTSISDDKEWRDWAEQQLKMYKEKKNLQNK